MKWAQSDARRPTVQRLRGSASGLTLTAALVLLLCAGCASVAPNTLVDGWSIGPDGGCEGGRPCDGLVRAATEALDLREPGHPLITNASLHAEGQYPRPDSSLGQMIRGGGRTMSVTLFRLADGSFRAIGVTFLMDSDTPQAFDRGPEHA